MTTKLLLNCLPPTNLYIPSLGCEVLKSYLDRTLEIGTKIIYWNHIFTDLYVDPTTEQNIFQPRNDLELILPFLAILAEKENNQKIRSRILLKMQECAPGLRSIEDDFYEKKYKLQIERIYKIIDIQLEKVLSDDVLFFGISGKFDAWIPGIILAQEVKKRKPSMNCILGGIEDVKAAQVVFELFDIFDYVIWGEGEIPLRMLVESIIKQQPTEIPRVLRRSEDPTLAINRSKSIESSNTYFNMNDYVELDYSGYFNYSKNIDKSKIKIPLEISRGCRWNRCNFCALNWGFTYRSKGFDHIVNEIKQHYNNHSITNFFFVDNDVVGKNIKHFENFLDSMIVLSSELEVDFHLHADILHLNFDKNLIRKLSLAGFKSIQVGYEAVTDSMLKKLNKSTTFAENLLFTKFTQKFDVELTISGLIIGLPNETEEDIIESTKNLHYLRFFLGQEKDKLKHRFAELMLFYNTGFWKMMHEVDIQNFNRHPLNTYLPDSLIKNQFVRFSLLGQYKQPILREQWDLFKMVSDHYEKSQYRYFIIKNNEAIQYLEYQGDLKVESILFDKPEYWEILRLANDRILTSSQLFVKTKEKFPLLREEDFFKILDELRAKYLLYCSENNRKIITIIDTDLL